MAMRAVSRDYDAASLMGIDLNSRFELSPGLKDCAALSVFVEELKRATRSK